MTFNIRQDVSLQPYNTMAVAAQADYFVVAESIQDVQQAVTFARQNNLAIFVLGEGSNTLFTQDYKGVVLLNRLSGMELLEGDPDSVVVKVAAGENWHSFVTHTVANGWYGLENLALIPGLVGAAPIQNIGAYGVEVKDYITEIEFLEFETSELRSMANTECEFAYRDSIFKHDKRGQGIITSVTFRLNKQPLLNLSYPALSTYLAGYLKPTPQDVFDAVIAIRSDKLPSPKEIPNLGSFFKNPVVDFQLHDKLKKEYPDLVSYPYQTGYKLAAAWLIDTAGWKSRTINQVHVHSEHALVVVNPDKVSGIHVLNFANELRSNIHQRFAIKLEVEPNIV